MRSVLTCVSLFLLLGATNAVAEAPDVPFVFGESNISDELSQQTVRQVYQDSTGYLWILTQEGLNRYDGRSVTVYRPDVNVPGTLRGSYTRGIAEDGEGNIWIATHGGGLNQYLPASDTFTSIRSGGDPLRTPISDRIWSLSGSPDGEIWLGYREGGFSAFDPKSLLFKHFTKQQWPELEHPVTDIVFKSENELLVATEGGGVFSFDSERETLSKFAGIENAEFKVGSDEIVDLHIDSRGRLWLATNDAGIWYVDGTADAAGRVEKLRYPERFAEPPVLGSLETHKVYEDSENHMLFATTAGVGLYYPEENAIQLFDAENSDLIQSKVISIFEDRSGRYWFGTFSGLSEGFVSEFYRVDSANGLLDETILSFSQSSNGDRWVGTASGLYRIPRNGSLNRLSRYLNADLGEIPITALMAEGNTLWVGTFSEGLKKVDLASGKVSSFAHNASDSTSLSGNAVTKIMRDSRGNLWVGTSRSGLNMQRPRESGFVRYRHELNVENSLSNDTVYAIYEERNGDLWIGTSRGLNRFNYDIGSFDHFMHDSRDSSGLAADVIYSIYEDREARLWIGTSGGALAMWEPVDRKRSVGKFEHFQQNIELPSSTVYAISGDDRGNIWASTTGGITRFNLNEGESKHYSVKDGLLSNDFNLGASFLDDKGWMYFGSSNGFNAFLPEDVEDNPLEPPVVLTRVVRNNLDERYDFPYTELGAIELSHKDYMIGFEFAALDYNQPTKNRYRYQMVGLNRSWVDLGNKAAVDFTNLKTGQYIFRIAASNADGVWNESGFTIGVAVLPPPWMTWWAFFLYIASSLLVVLVVLERQRQRERLQMQYQSQLESDVRARTRDLKRANENLQSAVEEAGAARQEAIHANQAKSEFLAALSHEIRTPMHGVLGMTDLLLHSGLSERQSGFANSAHGSANELLSLIDNILDFSKIEAGRLELEETTFNLREVTESLCYLYGEMAQAKGVELNLIFRANLRRQVYGDPVRLRQILQNLLSNAIKFTRRGRVDVTVEALSQEAKATRVRFTVADTGIGMDEQTQERVFEAFSQADSSTTRQFGGTGLGLSIAKQLIELMDGTLEVDSMPGVGTAMAVTLSLTESPIYADKLSVSRLQGFYAQVVAASAETRAMLSSQVEMLSLQAQEFAVVEEIPVRAENHRLVLVDVSSLDDNPSIAQVHNLAEDELTTVLLVTPLSMDGIPAELEHFPHTEKPCRTAELMEDITAALSPVEKGQTGWVAAVSTVLRYEQRVLVVEDMTANQEIARAMLESFGCSVDIANNGQVALEMYQQETYDIILMDCQMPVMDGFEATRHIRRLEAQLPGNVRIPIIAVTAGKTEVEKDRCFASGMDRILFKPYSTAELNNILAHYFASTGQVRGQEPPKPVATGARGASDVLDMKALDNIRSVELQTGNNLLAKVFENFKVDTEAKINELRSNLKDKAVLGSGAHAIKSMSLNIGAKSLSEYCRLRETAWKNNDIGNAEREVEVMYGHFLDVTRALAPIVAETEDES